MDNEVKAFRQDSRLSSSRLGKLIVEGLVDLIKDKSNYATLFRILPQPETSIYSKKRASQFLQRFSTIYVKPCDRSFSRGILLLYIQDGCLAIQYPAIKGYGYPVSCLPEKTGMKLVDEYVTGHKRKYLIQQGIEPLQYKNKSTHIRVLYQREVENNNIHKMILPIAGGAINGKSLDWFDFANETGLTDKYLFTLLEMSDEAWNIIESKLGQRVVRIGFDYVIGEEDKRIYFLEANANPFMGRFLEIKNNHNSYVERLVTKAKKIIDATERYALSYYKENVYGT